MPTPESHAAGPRLETPPQSPALVLGVALLAVIVVMLMVLMVQVMDLKTARTTTDRDLAEVQRAQQEQKRALERQAAELGDAGARLHKLDEVVSFKGAHGDATRNPITRAIDDAIGSQSAQPVTAPIPEWMYTPPAWWTEGPPARGSDGDTDAGEGANASDGDGDTGTGDSNDTGNGTDTGSGTTAPTDDNLIPVYVYVAADVDIAAVQDAARRFREAVGARATLSIRDLTPAVFEQLNIDPKLPDGRSPKCLALVQFPGESQVHWAASENGDAIIQAARRIVLHFDPDAFDADTGADTGADDGSGSDEATGDGTSTRADEHAAMLALATECATRFMTGLSGDRDALLGAVDFTAVRAAGAHAPLVADAQILLDYYATTTGFAFVSVDSAHEKPGVTLHRDADGEGWVAAARWSYECDGASGRLQVDMRFSPRDGLFRVVVLRDALLVDMHGSVTVVRGDWVYRVTRAVLARHRGDADWIPADDEYISRHNRRPPVAPPASDYAPPHNANAPEPHRKAPLARVSRVDSATVGALVSLDSARMPLAAGAYLVIRGGAGDVAVVRVVNATGQRASARVMRLLGARRIGIGDTAVAAPADLGARPTRREPARNMDGGRR